jgi:leucyl-tRNA synthetase
VSDYKASEIEPKWQRFWEERRIFHRRADDARPKYYLLEMLPYPSGDLHMGHMRNYTLGDAVARYKRMKGFNVFHPIGWDAFGLPAENAAITRKTHPRAWTLSNIARMKEQLQRFGYSYDWSSEISTCEPEYYRWNQWFFLQMFERGLAFRKKSRVNWCSACQTVLANEQVVDGCCWRHEETPVEQRELEQWFLKITEYVDELLAGLRDLAGNWPDRILTMQRNWIGKSEGARVRWPVAGGDKVIETFTRRWPCCWRPTIPSSTNSLPACRAGPAARAGSNPCAGRRVELRSSAKSRRKAFSPAVSPCTRSPRNRFPSG